MIDTNSSFGRKITQLTTLLKCGKMTAFLERKLLIYLMIIKLNSSMRLKTTNTMGIILLLNPHTVGHSQVVFFFALLH